MSTSSSTKKAEKYFIRKTPKKKKKIGARISKLRIRGERNSNQSEQVSYMFNYAHYMASPPASHVTRPRRAS